MLEDNIDKDIQGVALYAEWVRLGSLTQVFITPDGFNSDASFLRSRIYHRVISTAHPRTQWRCNPLMHSKRFDMPQEVLDDSGEARTLYASKRIGYSSSLMFKKLLIGGWAMNSQPIFIEMSKKDFDDMSRQKTPNKFLYRVDLGKKAKGDFSNPLEELEA